MIDSSKCALTLAMHCSIAGPLISGAPLQTGGQGCHHPSPLMINSSHASCEMPVVQQCSLCCTHRGFVVAGLADTQKPEENISPNMTGGEPSTEHVANAPSHLLLTPDSFCSGLGALDAFHARGNALIRQRFAVSCKDISPPYPPDAVMCIYSMLFMRFAWVVQPRNYLLLTCHMCNETVQQYQMFRCSRN